MHWTAFTVTFLGSSDWPVQIPTDCSSWSLLTVSLSVLVRSSYFSSPTSLSCLLFEKITQVAHPKTFPPCQLTPLWSFSSSVQPCLSIHKNMECFLNLCVIPVQGPGYSSLYHSTFSICTAKVSTDLVNFYCSSSSLQIIFFAFFLLLLNLSLEIFI